MYKHIYTNTESSDQNSERQQLTIRAEADADHQADNEQGDHEAALLAIHLVRNKADTHVHVCLYKFYHHNSLSINVYCMKTFYSRKGM